MRSEDTQRVIDLVKNRTWPETFALGNALADMVGWVFCCLLCHTQLVPKRAMRDYVLSVTSSMDLLDHGGHYKYVLSTHSVSSSRSAAHHVQTWRALSIWSILRQKPQPDRHLIELRFRKKLGQTPSQMMDGIQADDLTAFWVKWTAPTTVL
ncbi:hypothetical protein BD777DRAFT_164219 [Yarrowia lipolytica]|nr:hypothetical protein BD777DRAFT_164219 [Yarrowia lipolytica]